MIYLAGTDFSHLTNDELIKGIRASNLPDYIRSKSYGIDVRETLAQMTEMTIQLGVNMGLSPDDALSWARKLQESVSQSEFDSWVSTLLDGGPSIFMNTLSELKTTYPNGAAGVALVRETDPAKIYVWNGTAWEDFGAYQGIEVKNGSIVTSKISDNAVTPIKTNFLKTGKNLYDKDNLTAGYAINASGELFPSSTYYVTDFINILPNTTYHADNHNIMLALYDSAFSFISRPLNRESGAFTTPENTAYARIAVFEGARTALQVEQGDVATDREDYSISMDKLKLKQTNFSEKTMPTETLEQIVIGKNLFDIRKATKGRLNMATGTIDSALEGEASDFIAIEPATDYSKNKIASFSFYDENQSFIPIQLGTGSGKYHSQMTTFSSPANAQYIRIGSSGGLSGTQLERGVNVTDYQPFGYYISDFLYAYEINELRKELNALPTGGVSKELKYPTPALVEPDISLIGGASRSVSFVDKYDNLWAIQWDNKIYKNPVNTDKWELVIDVNPFIEREQSPLETISGYALVVSDTGRIVVATSRGRVLVSDEEQTTLNEAFTFKGGYTQTTWGFDKQGQYILMGSYLVHKNAENPGREVYLSKDHGLTWELIFDKPIVDMEDASDYHIHDVAFDPYSGAILVVQGDMVNNQIYYSYDLGNTWKEVNPEGTSKVHPTSILCFPEGIAFGSDELPEGISWWDRPTDETEPDIKHDDIYWKKKFNLGENIIGNIAVKGATLFDESGLYGVIGFMNHNTSAPGYPRLFATGDGGRSWHQIWKSDNQIDENGFFNTLLRKTDSGIEIYSRYSIGGQPNLFKVNMPTFIPNTK